MTAVGFSLLPPALSLRHARPVPTSVLVVDDDPAFRMVAGELLNARGFDVAGYAGDEDETISAVQRLRPGGVLLDLHLAAEDGFQVARRLSSFGQPPAVLLTSADSDAANRPLAIECGAVGFVPKADLAVADLRCYFNG
jgi:CheY-like chemotaxis protein